MLMPLLDLIAFICFVTAAIDMAANGARYASWAPWGVSIAVVVAILHMATI